MKILKGKFGLRKMNILEASYPKWEIALAVLLLYLAPFTTELLTYAALLICAYRIVMYDARVFVTDYAILLPVSQLFRAGGMSLLIYLCLFAAIWYFARGKIEKQFSYAVLLLLLNYLVLRMQWNISSLVLCFGQLFMLSVLLPKQDESSADQAIKMFCLSLAVSSFYAYILRDTSQLFAVRGKETAAFWASSFNRFQGLFADPNYYMALLITAMTLLLRMRDCGKIQTIPFLLLEMCFIFFGALTYSKTFFLLLIMLVLMGIISLFQNKKYLLGSVCVVIAGLVTWFLFSGTTIFSVVLFRFRSATNLDDLTTGRSEVYVNYMNAITSSISSFLFGAGLAAENLGKDPHNLFLEILYYLGAVGLLLMVILCVVLLLALRKQLVNAPKQKWLAKNSVMLMVLVLHLTLHGMFSIISYAVFFFAFLSAFLIKRTEES